MQVTDMYPLNKNKIEVADFIAAKTGETKTLTVAHDDASNEDDEMMVA